MLRDNPKILFQKKLIQHKIHQERQKVLFMISKHHKIHRELKHSQLIHQEMKHHHKIQQEKEAK
jgi:hypothetical protein